MTDQREHLYWLARPLERYGSSATTLVVFGYVLLATVIAGAGSPPAGLAVLVFGLLTGLVIEVARWHREEAAAAGPAAASPANDASARSTPAPRTPPAAESDGEPASPGRNAPQRGD